MFFEIWLGKSDLFKKTEGNEGSVIRLIKQCTDRYLKMSILPVLFKSPKNIGYFTERDTSNNQIYCAFQAAVPSVRG